MDRRLRPDPRPDRGRRDAGFTLIELMIAVTVLALLSTTITLSVARPTGEGATDAARLMALHERLQRQAVLSREILGLRLDAEGYRRLRRDAAGWVEVGTAGRWQGSVAMQVPADRREAVQFLPSGQSTAVRIVLDGRTCETDGWGPLRCAGG